MNTRMIAGAVALWLATGGQAWSQERDAGARAGQGTRDTDRGAELRRARERLRRVQESARERRTLRQGREVTESVSRTARIGRDGSLDLSNLAGRVAVTGIDGDDVRIEAVKRVWHPNAERGRQLLQALEIDITEGAARVRVATRYPRERSYDAEVDYTVSVPRDARVTVRAASGDVVVANLRGELTVEAVSGSVTASSVGDVRLLRSVSGAVSVDGAAGDAVTASSVGGPISIRHARVRTIEARSVGGPVSLSDSEADRVAVRALSGDVEFGGRISRTGRYELQTRTGRVLVTPVSAEGFDVEAATVGGQFRSDFPLTLSDSRSGARRGGERVRLVQGRFGDGGGLLTLRSFSGLITIEKPR